MARLDEINGDSISNCGTFRTFFVPLFQNYDFEYEYSSRCCYLLLVRQPYLKIFKHRTVLFFRFVNSLTSFLSNNNLVISKHGVGKYEFKKNNTFNLSKVGNVKSLLERKCLASMCIDLHVIRIEKIEVLKPTSFKSLVAVKSPSDR